MGVLHPKWCRISSINSIKTRNCLWHLTLLFLKYIDERPEVGSKELSRMVTVSTGQTMSNCLRFWFVWHCWVVDILDRFHINSNYFLPTSKRAIDASKMPSRGPNCFWRFRVSLRQLIGKIDVSDPHFVRCIKPNPEKARILLCKHLWMPFVA